MHTVAAACAWHVESRARIHARTYNAFLGLQVWSLKTRVYAFGKMAEELHETKISSVSFGTAADSGTQEQTSL